MILCGNNPKADTTMADMINSIIRFPRFVKALKDKPILAYNLTTNKVIVDGYIDDISYLSPLGLVLIVVVEADVVKQISFTLEHFAEFILTESLIYKDEDENAEYQYLIND